MELDEAFEVLDAYELEASYAAWMVAHRGSASLLAEGEEDLPHPVSEDRILQAMRTVIGSLGDIEAVRTLWARYPATCAFYLIDVGRREYESGGLYPRIAEELGIKIEQYVNKWANHFVRFLDSVHLQRFTHETAAKYKLESILLHGGLPDDAWHQVWENWIIPGISAGMREVNELAQWALSTAHDSPQLRTTTRDILQNGGQLVEGLVAEAVRAAVDSVDTGLVDESVGYALPAAALLSLEHVLGTPRLRWPELRFDLEAANVVFVDVPKIDLGRQGGSEETSIFYDIFEVGESPELVRGDESVASPVSGSWRLQGFSIPLRAASGFEALIRWRSIGRARQGGQKRIRWKANGQGIWTFMRDRRGQWTCPPESSWKRPRNEVLYLVPPGHRIQVDGSNGCGIVQSTVMDGDWDGWTAYHVRGTGGCAISLQSMSGEEVGAWEIGQKCSIHLEGEDDATIGHLILDRLCPVFGLALPSVVVGALDPSVELAAEQWSCFVRWGGGAEGCSLSFPLVMAEDAYRLRADLTSLERQLPQVVDDGEIVVSGPQGCGSFRQRFARVALSRPSLRDLSYDEFGGMWAEYDIEGGGDVTLDVKHEDVRVSREGFGYRLVAPASLESMAVLVACGGHRISMKMVLAGVTLEAEGIELPQGEDPLVVPEAALARLAGAVVRVGVSRFGGCVVSLDIMESGGERTTLRQVGLEGRFKDALGFSELDRVLPPSGDAVLTLTVHSSAARVERKIVRIMPGLGVGRIRLDRSADELRIVCERPAVADIDILLVDFTAPWRNPPSGRLAVGETSTHLSGPGFPLCKGRYGIWAQLVDDWDTGVDLSVEPQEVFDITYIDNPDDAPAMGPYHLQLAQLLWYRAGLAERPQLKQSSALPTSHMLEMDARATVSTMLTRVRHSDRGYAQALEDVGSAAALGRDIMRLSEYRYAHSPAVLRCLTEARLDGWMPKEVLLTAVGLRLPFLEVRPEACALFEEEELRAAWEVHPYLGFLTSIMHACAGDHDGATIWVDRWLKSSSAGTREALLVQLEVDRTACRHVAEGKRLSPAPTSLITRTFADWMHSSTQRQQLTAARCVRAHLGRARKALDRFRGSAGPLSLLVDVVEARDCGEYTKTIANLPFLSGALAVAALATRIGHFSSGSLLTDLAVGVRADWTHTAAVEQLIGVLEVCPDVVGMDLFLVGLWWALESGDL